SAAAHSVRPAKSYQLGNNYTSFEVNADSAGVVLLSETNQPHTFRAWINGVESPVIGLNYALKGVYISKPGHYSIRFEYRPRFWGISCYLFAAAGIALALMMLRMLCAFSRERRECVVRHDTSPLCNSRQSPPQISVAS